MISFVLFSMTRAWQGFWRNAVMSIAATATMVLMLLLLASWVGRRWFSVLAIALTIALALFVGWARMYRGMHHLTDSAAGVIMGLLALGITVFAARAATAAANARDAAGGESR